ncbi:MAG TPA: hypothetical protein VFT72_07205 [Opitutaceae bacterium]|nr:hypothetical protein [Opitutaceae bacterium]
MTPIILRAGPLEAELMPDEGALRHVYFDGAEVVRGIAAPIRDEAWATIRPEISALAIDRRDDAFRVTFAARCNNGAVDFSWRGEIVGTAAGALTFIFSGEALRDFRRNRIGFCLLHGTAMSGRPVEIEHVDGAFEHGVFPVWIQSGAPFSEIRGFRYMLENGTRAEVRLEGDTFEMEDQRNWTDASFKTYCTSLRLPYPVLVRRGERVEQRVVIGLRRSAASTTKSPSWSSQTQARDGSADVLVSIGSQLGRSRPRLGTAWHPLLARANARAALAELRLDHLRVDLRLSDPAHLELFREATEAARAIGAALEVAVFARENEARQWTELHKSVDRRSGKPRIARWIVFHEDRDVTPLDLLRTAREKLCSPTDASPVGGGVTDNFAELNVAPDIARAGDFVAIACNPQVHAFDDFSVMETLAMHGEIVRNAARHAQGRPVIVSPVTLTRRWRLKDHGAPLARPAGMMPFQTDARHATDFARAWTAGSLASLAYAGTSSVTYFEALGENGLFSADVNPFPLAAVFRGLAGTGEAELLDIQNQAPARVAALAFANHGEATVLLANLCAIGQRVCLTVAGAPSSTTVELAPHEIQIRELPGIRHRS